MKTMRRAAALAAVALAAVALVGCSDDGKKSSASPSSGPTIHKVTDRVELPDDGVAVTLNGIGISSDGDPAGSWSFVEMQAKVEALSGPVTGYEPSAVSFTDNATGQNLTWTVHGNNDSVKGVVASGQPGLVTFSFQGAKLDQFRSGTFRIGDATWTGDFTTLPAKTYDADGNPTSATPSANATPTATTEPEATETAEPETTAAPTRSYPAGGLQPGDDCAHALVGQYDTRTGLKCEETSTGWEWVQP